MQEAEVQNGYLGSEREEGGLSQVNGPGSRHADDAVWTKRGRAALIGLWRASAGGDRGAGDRFEFGAQLGGRHKLRVSGRVRGRFKRPM